MNLLQRILLAFGIIVVIGGAIKLLGLNDLDACDDSDLIQNLSECPWKLEGGRQIIQFNENGTFTLSRPFNNDGVSSYQGTFRLLDDCKLLFPNAKSGSEYDGVEVRHVELTFLTNGELSSSTGETVDIDFITTRYNTFMLSGVAYYKEWDFPELTKGN